MPNKNAKIARRTAGKQKSFVPTSKDDGTRWIVVRHGEPVYRSVEGLPKAEAQRLADGLLEPAQTLQI